MTLNLKKSLHVFVLLGVLTGTALTQDDAIKAEKIKDIVIGQSMVIPSKALGVDFKINVRMPEGYDESREYYPVLYSLGSGFLGVCGLATYWTLPKMVIINIEGDEAGRFHMLLYQEGGFSADSTDEFLRFFLEELIPYVDSHYRTLPYRVAWASEIPCSAPFVYAFMKRPDLINACIVNEPDHQSGHLIQKNIESWLNSRTYKNNFLFLTSSNDPEGVVSHKVLTEILKRVSPEGLKWEEHLWLEEEHRTVHPRTLFNGLRAVFSDLEWNSIPEVYLEKGFQGFLDYQKILAAKYGKNIGFPHLPLHEFGTYQMRKENYDEAIAVFEFLIKNNSIFDGSYYILGTAYEAAGHLQSAKKAYIREYEIQVKRHPALEKTYKKMLDQILSRLRSKKLGRFHNIVAARLNARHAAELNFKGEGAPSVKAC